ncbi:hypothetical protein MSG28_009218 [Choristoneura fumiferana]|uniref:Uncharacterized protein n=1 Tax=Choristoneura fumiferana TaxID=7141 RepID=A0ACC0KX89_CHOFU|nr:hypothetical protein MSG28_009218 [Choristoneura fumiferana]
MKKNTRKWKILAALEPSRSSQDHNNKEVNKVFAQDRTYSLGEKEENAAAAIFGFEKKPSDHWCVLNLEEQRDAVGSTLGTYGRPTVSADTGSGCN